MKRVEELFREAHRLHFAKLRQTLCAFSLGKGQPHILRYLAQNDGATQSEIAKRECVTPATTTVMLQTMEKNGLIERKSDENDLRIMRVFITEKGKEVLKESTKAIEEMEEEIYADFTQEEIELFCQLLEKKRDKLKNLLGMEE